MANEKATEKVNEIAKEASNNLTNEKTEIKTSSEGYLNLDDIFGSDDSEEIIDDEASVSSYIGSTVIFGDCGNVRREKAGVKDGFQYYNYKVKFKAPVNGKFFEQELFLRLKENFKAKHELLNELFGEERMAPLFIVRAERIKTGLNGVKTREYYYTPTIIFNGGMIDYKFSFLPTSQETFELLLDILKTAKRVE